MLETFWGVKPAAPSCGPSRQLFLAWLFRDHSGKGHALLRALRRKVVIVGGCIQKRFQAPFCRDRVLHQRLLQRGLSNILHMSPDTQYNGVEIRWLSWNNSQAVIYSGLHLGCIWSWTASTVNPHWKVQHWRDGNMHQLLKSPHFKDMESGRGRALNLSFSWQRHFRGWWRGWGNSEFPS
jgi:hypothetical protein